MNVLASILGAWVASPLAQQAGPPGGGGNEGFLQMLFMLGPMALIFYFLLWRPESKRRKEKEQMMNSLKAKDKIVTIGGIHGIVVSVDKDEVVVRVDTAKDIKMRFRRTAIDVIESSGSDKSE